ncbi:MAG: NAD(P)/FAD-dependent oxidoreductase [Terracidiphilus sp.]|jgi:phytoene dehydrogenase-like protein
MTKELAENLNTEGGGGFAPYEKIRRERQEVSGHDFSRAEYASRMSWGSAPEKVISPTSSEIRRPSANRNDARRAQVIGSGPNGLAAAITLAQAGLQVVVYEAEPQPGGAARTMQLTLPGFHHDFGSAVHPMAVGSPFFASLALEQHGLQWIHGSAPLAHPLDDGSAVILERDLADAETALRPDGRAWRKLFQTLVDHWPQFAQDALGPVTRLPHHPFLMARFGCHAFQPALRLAAHHFAGERARALFAGLAAHSFLSLDQPLSSAVGLVIGAAAHAVGWPISRGGSQAITDALASHLLSLGGEIRTGTRISSLDQLDAPGALILCDVTPRQLLSIAADRLPPSCQKAFQRFRYGPGAFKIDYALSQPIPWRAPECARAITVHLGGTMEEIAQSEFAVTHSRIVDRPFVLVAQPSLFDPARAPQGRHVAWVYCHVPNGSTVDMTTRIEAQLERFAPGFRDCVLARRVSAPAQLEAMDANLVGGDINGGELSLRQFFFRPSRGNYSTGTPNLYLCSSSTPPGGGVHGMCGYHAALAALRHLPS